MLLAMRRASSRVGGSGISRIDVAIRKPPPIADEPKRQEGSVEWILNRALAPVGEIVAGK